jgi:hypothetical protein
MPSRGTATFLVPALHLFAEIELDGLSLEELVEVNNGPGHPFSSVHRELPASNSITATFSTVVLKDVHSSGELNCEIEFSGFTSLPDASALLLHDLSIEQD